MYLPLLSQRKTAFKLTCVNRVYGVEPFFHIVLQSIVQLEFNHDIHTTMVLT